MAQPSLTITVTKGHGTANDFVLFRDPEDALDLSPAQYRQLADRHRGVGGDLPDEVFERDPRGGGRDLSDR